MRKIFSLAILTSILIFAIVIGSQNPSVIQVNYLIAQADLKVSTLMAICFTVGLVTAMFAMMVTIVNLRWQIQRLKSKTQ